MLSAELFLGPAFVQEDTPINLIRIRSVVTERGTELSLGKPGVGLMKACGIVVQASVRRHDLPDIQARSGDASSSTGGTIGEHNVGAASHFGRFGKQLNGYRREVLIRDFCQVLNRFNDFSRDPQALLSSTHNFFPFWVSDIKIH
jgi:hypothetical protein